MRVALTLMLYIDPFDRAWEHIVTFSVEWQRWKQLIKRREVVLVNICVIVSRYLSWTNAISSAFFFFGNPFSCQSTFTWIFVTYFLIWVSQAGRHLSRLAVSTC